MSFLKFAIPAVLGGSAGMLLYNHRQNKAAAGGGPQSLRDRFRTFASIGDGRCMVLEDFILSCCAVPPPPPPTSNSRPPRRLPPPPRLSSLLRGQLFKSIDADGTGH